MKEANNRLEQTLKRQNDTRQSASTANSTPQFIQPTPAKVAIHPQVTPVNMAVTRAQKRLQQIASNATPISPPEPKLAPEARAPKKIISTGNKETVMVIGDSNTKS